MTLLLSILCGLVVGQWCFIFILWRWCTRLDVHQEWAEDEICQLKHDLNYMSRPPTTKAYTPMFSNQSWSDYER